ncbi:MAG: polymer-forming cytoskeletal protein [Acidobacteria bacterium]|jgi:cytoskeletal protein CcmA (bactofilin family)|nr:polymer-forming cytoskeletal protein [Acidobacteriota bacterium]
MGFRRGKSAGEIVSHLGEGAELNGDLLFATGARINGVLKGRVKAEAALEIGPGGRVEAEAHVRRISIRGEYRGTIHASDRVEIHKEGKVFGEIYSPCLIIEAGAVFEGRCNMGADAPPEGTGSG